MSFKRRDIVKDEFGNYFAIERVNDDGTVDLHSVATKESWTILPHEAGGLELQEGLAEA